MTQQEFCQKCNQKHSCHRMYQQLGETKGPSVTFKVLVAFLFPMITFIATLIVSQYLLTNSINTKGLQTVISFLLALSATFILILVVKAGNSRRQKKP